MKPPSPTWTARAATRAEARLRAVVERAADGYTLLDAAGTVIDLSPSAQRMSGYAPEQIVGRRCDDFVHPDDLAAATATLARLRGRRGASEALLLRLRHTDGSWRWIEGTLTNMLHDPAVEALVMNYRDVTERVAAQETLRRTEQRYRGLFEQSVAGVVHTRLDGTILEASDTFARIVGFASASEVAGRNAREFWRDPRDRTAILERLQSGPVVDEVSLRRRDGSDLVALIHITLVKAEDRSPSLQTTLIDVTPRRSAEEQRDRLMEEIRSERRQLEALSRRLVVLQEQERRAIARELHDQIGQLLTGLKLLAESEGGKEQLLEVVGELIRRVRSLSLDLRPPMLDTLGLVPALLWHVDRYTAQTGVRVEFRELRPARRYSSDTEIAAFRIVQEALTNVARHAGVREASIEVDASDERLQVRIADRGRGFEPAQAAGIGLTGMQERAQILGGRIRFESRPGQGTTVEAELPATRRELVE